MHDIVYELVWIIDDAVLGQVIEHGTYASLVRFVKNDVLYEVYLDNSEFYVKDEFSIGVEEE